MIDLTYVAAPLAGYMLGGTTKFVVNAIRTGAWARALSQVGLGGFPSTHTSIVSAAFWSVILGEGWHHPVVAVAGALLLVVSIDAMDLRKKVERLNRVAKAQFPNSTDAQALRGRVGHTPGEIMGGIATGFVAALLLSLL